MQNYTYKEGIISYRFDQWKASLRQSSARLLKEYKIYECTFCIQSFHNGRYEKKMTIGRVTIVIIPMIH